MPTGTRQKADPLRSWARAQARVHSEIEAVPFAMAVANQVGRSLGRMERVEPSPELKLAEPPGGWANPWLVGLAHEQAATSADRTKRGAFYTPRSLVQGLVGLALPARKFESEFTVDPTCGGGAFLLAALDHLVSYGTEPKRAIELVGGMDIDSGAVKVARTAIELWALAKGLGEIKPRVEVADALICYPSHWPSPDFIVGNPPFASPLKTDAVDTTAKQFRAARDELLGPYADTAACHLLRAIELLKPGGVVCLVQPVSVLAGRDTEAFRQHLNRVAPTKAIWCTKEAVFDAGVRVAAPVLVVAGDQDSSVELLSGPSPSRVAVASSAQLKPTGRKWSTLAAMALGVPWVDLDEGSYLGQIAEATAGFRDEHYGLAAACVEQVNSNSELRLTTVGSIDPLFAWWGHRPTRFARTKWSQPVIEPERLDPKILRWVQNQQRPKVVLPTQSRVLEPLIDFEGNIVPATPVLAIHTAQENLFHVAAVLLAPPVVAWALQRSFGSAMSLDAVKLSATQVLQLPLPLNKDPWDSAADVLSQNRPNTYAEALKTAKLVAGMMMDAYEASSEVMDWYQSRFPVA